LPTAEARERRYLDQLDEQRVRGVLVTPVDHASHARLGELVQRGIPVVLVDRGAGTRNRCSVAVDDVLGGRLAATHLVEQGHRRVALVGGPMAIPQVADRHAGASAVVTSVAGASMRLVEMPALTIAHGRTAARQLAGLPADERPTAVFCANDLLALGLLAETLGDGLRVPEDLAIVGYDDIEYAGAAPVALSSVAQPRELLGRTATELLLDEVKVAAEHRHREVVFEPELVVRASSRVHPAHGARLGIDMAPCDGSS
jgi:LacI family transcriptional regulator